MPAAHAGMGASAGGGGASGGAGGGAASGGGRKEASGGTVIILSPMKLETHMPSEEWKWQQVPLPDTFYEGGASYKDAITSPLNGRVLDPYYIHPIDPANPCLEFLHKHPYWAGGLKQC